LGLSSQAKAQAVASVAGLVAAYARNVVQYHQYSWDSFESFLGFWLAHYVGIVLCAVLAYAFVQGQTATKFGASDELRKITSEDAVVLTAVFVTILAVLLLVGAHASVSDD
jgi:hypothetical protein